MNTKNSLDDQGIIAGIKQGADCRAVFKRFWPDHFRERGNCVCPWHDDSTASLQVSKEFAYCHAEQKNLDAIDLFELGAGVSKREAIKKLAEELGLNGSKPIIAATYDYHDRDGKLLFQTVRMVPKNFRQRRPDGNGGWIWNLQGIEPVPYRLPAVLAAQEVFIVEGEKDADRLVSIGLAATTSPMGAGKWRESYSVHFAGKDIVILPDNDEPGRTHADKIARNLLDHASTVKILNLPGLPDKGDVSDWLDNGGSVAELIQMVKNQPVFDPAETKTEQGVQPVVPMDPIHFDDIEVPPISCSLLPSWAGDFAAAVSEGIQVPPELAVANVLGVVSLCVARKFIIQVKPDYCEPLNLYILAPLPPGERKSSTLSACTQPLADWERARAAELRPVMREVESSIRTYNKMIESLRTRAAKAKSQADRDKIIADIRDLEEQLPEPVTVPRLLADDITPEGAAPLMACNYERLGIISAEGGIFDILAGRYSRGIPNLDLFLKAHPGDSCSVDRKGSPPIILRNPALTMCLSPQPDVLMGLFDKPGFRGRGLLGRFLYFMGESRLGAREIDVPPIPEGVRQDYHERITALLNLPWGKDSYGEETSYVLKLSRAAYSEWALFWRAVERELAPEGSFCNMRDWAGKLPGACARLAGIFHMISHAGGKIPLDVGTDNLGAALTLGAALAKHARKAFGVMGADPAIECGKKILQWIKRTSQETFTARDCHRALEGTYPRRADLEPGLSVLEERGYITQLPPEPTPAIGRPTSTRYAVNPKTREESK